MGADNIDVDVEVDHDIDDVNTNDVFYRLEYRQCANDAMMLICAQSSDVHSDINRDVNDCDVQDGQRAARPYADHMTLTDASNLTTSATTTASTTSTTKTINALKSATQRASTAATNTVNEITTAVTVAAEFVLATTAATSVALLGTPAAVATAETISKIAPAATTFSQRASSVNIEASSQFLIANVDNMTLPNETLSALTPSESKSGVTTSLQISGVTTSRISGVLLSPLVSGVAINTINFPHKSLSPTQPPREYPADAHAGETLPLTAEELRWNAAFLQRQASSNPAIRRILLELFELLEEEEKEEEEDDGCFYDDDDNDDDDNDDECSGDICSDDGIDVDYYSSGTESAGNYDME